jgi:hypothetical protein
VIVGWGVGGGWVGRFGVPGAGVDVGLARDHSVVLARVKVSSVSGRDGLKLSLALSDEI